MQVCVWVCTHGCIILFHSLTAKLLNGISHLHLDLMKTVFNNSELEVLKEKTAKKNGWLKKLIQLSQVKMTPLKKRNGIKKSTRHTKLSHKLQVKGHAFSKADRGRPSAVCVTCLRWHFFPILSLCPSPSLSHHFEGALSWSRKGSFSRTLPLLNPFPSFVYSLVAPT